MRIGKILGGTRKAEPRGLTPARTGCRLGTGSRGDTELCGLDEEKKVAISREEKGAGAAVGGAWSELPLDKVPC